MVSEDNQSTIHHPPSIEYKWIILYSIDAQTANKYGGDQPNIHGLTFGRSSLSHDMFLLLHQTYLFIHRF